MSMEPMNDRRQNCTCWKRQQCTAGPPTSFLLPSVLPSIPLRRHTLSIVGMVNDTVGGVRGSPCNVTAVYSTIVTPSFCRLQLPLCLLSMNEWMNEWMNKAVWEMLTWCLIAVLSHSDIWSVPFRNFCWSVPFRDCTIQRHMLIYLIQRMYHLETSAHLSHSEVVPFRDVCSSVPFRDCTHLSHSDSVPFRNICSSVPFRDCPIQRHLLICLSQRHLLICPIQWLSHSERYADLFITPSEGY